MRRAALLFALLLAACAGGEPAGEAPPPADETLESQLSLARFAFREARYDRAEAIYLRALGRARERDDPAAYALVSYELAATRLRLGDAAGATWIASDAEAALARRGAPADPRLALVAGAAALALDEAALALERAGDAEAATEPALAARAHWLAGRAAAALGDSSRLARAAAALAASPGADPADEADLAARLAAAEGRHEEARKGFEAAAALRQQALDYGAMAEALAAAAGAAAARGDPAAAADLWLRAGRSAAERKEARAALWLDEAARAAEAAGLPDVARAAAAARKGS